MYEFHHPPESAHQFIHRASISFSLCLFTHFQVILHSSIFILFIFPCFSIRINADVSIIAKSGFFKWIEQTFRLLLVSLCILTGLSGVTREGGGGHVQRESRTPISPNSTHQLIFPHMGLQRRELHSLQVAYGVCYRVTGLAFHVWTDLNALKRQDVLPVQLFNNNYASLYFRLMCFKVLVWRLTWQMAVAIELDNCTLQEWSGLHLVSEQFGWKLCQYEPLKQYPLPLYIKKQQNKTKH